MYELTCTGSVQLTLEWYVKRKKLNGSKCTNGKPFEAKPFSGILHKFVQFFMYGFILHTVFLIPVTKILQFCNAQYRNYMKIFFIAFLIP